MANTDNPFIRIAFMHMNNKEVQQTEKKNVITKVLLRNLSVKNALFMLFGVILIGIGGGMFRLVDLGVDPFACTVKGVSAWTGVQFGNVQLIYNLSLLIFVLFFCRESLGLGTIFNMVGVGYISDLTLWITSDVLKLAPGMAVRVLLLLVFLIIFALGIAMYMEADMGTAPYDTLGEIIDHATHGKIPFKYARVGLDVTSVLLGILFGTVLMHEKVFGVGTIVLAVCTGLVVGTFRKFFHKSKE